MNTTQNEPVMKINIPKEVFDFIQLNSTKVFTTDFKLFVQPKPYWYKPTSESGVYEVYFQLPNNIKEYNDEK
jgi:hypothetical protein